MFAFLRVCVCVCVCACVSVCVYVCVYMREPRVVETMQPLRVEKKEHTHARAHTHKHKQMACNPPRSTLRAEERGEAPPHVNI